MHASFLNHSVLTRQDINVERSGGGNNGVLIAYEQWLRLVGIWLNSAGRQRRRLCELLQRSAHGERPIVSTGNAPRSDSKKVVAPLLPPKTKSHLAEPAARSLAASPVVARQAPCRLQRSAIHISKISPLFNRAHAPVPVRRV